MEKLIEGSSASCVEAISRRKTSLCALSALLIAVATAGCSAEVEGTEGAFAEPAESSEGRLREATSELSRVPFAADTGDDTAPLWGGAPLSPKKKPPPPPPGPAPVVLAQQVGLETPLVLHGPNVFFSGAITHEANFSFVGMVPKAGGPKTLLAEDAWYTPTLVSDATSAYAIFDEWSTGSVVHELGDGTITPAPITETSLYYATLDATNLYWWDSSTNTVRASPRAGGPSFQVTKPVYPMEATVFTQSLKVDDTSVYIMAGDQHAITSTVWKAPKASPAPADASVLIGPVPYSVVSITMDATDLYFANRASGLFKVPKSGGPVVQLESTATEMSIAIDAERYYWFQGTSLMATRKDGSGSQVLVTVTPPGTKQPGILAVDSGAVYWRSPSTIWKFAK